eukprot:2556457-Pyramimonas_sp.AAC.1
MARSAARPIVPELGARSSDWLDGINVCVFSRCAQARQPYFSSRHGPSLDSKTAAATSTRHAGKASKCLARLRGGCARRPE